MRSSPRFRPASSRSSARVTELRHAGTLRARDDRGGPVQANAVILAVPAYAAGGIAARRRHGARRALRRHAVRVDRHRRVRLSPRSGWPSDARQRLRRATCRTEPAARRNLGHLEVAASRARRTTSCCADFSAAAATRVGSTQTDDELIDTRARAGSGRSCPSRESRSSRACTAGPARARSTRSVTSQRVATIERHLARFPGLFVTGSGFRSIGIPDCIADGRETAARAATFVATKAAKTFGHEGHEDQKVRAQSKGFLCVLRG